MSRVPHTHTHIHFPLNSSECVTVTEEGEEVDVGESPAQVGELP